MPNVSLCQLGFPDTTFAGDVAIATSVGAGGLGLDDSKLAGEDLAGQRALLRDAGLTATICAPGPLSILPLRGTDMFPGPSDPEARVETLLAGVERLATFEPVAMFCLTGPAGDLGERRARSVVVEALRGLADAAAEYGTRVGVEPMRESFRPGWTIVSSLRETLDLLDEVGRDEIGIVFDVWHMWDSPEVHEILAPAVDRIVGVQIADYRDPTRSPLDRVAAGEGIAGVATFLDELRSAGYDGWYDLEVFSDDGRFGSDYEDSLWKLEPTEYARRQMNGFLECWGA